MRRAPCVAFFCDAFCRPRCSPRISFPPNSCGRPIPQQSEQLRFSCFGSRSQRFGMHSSKSRSQRFIIFIARPVDMLALISTHAWLHVAAARTRGCMPGRSTARDSCNPRPQWSSPGPRSTGAPRARDGRMHPAPAMDGCTPQAIGAGFAWTEQAVLTTLDAAHAVVLLPANALTCAGSSCSDRTTSDRQGSGFAWTQQAAGVV